MLKENIEDNESNLEKYYHELKVVEEKSNFVLVPLMLVTGILMLWCFYLRWI